MNHPSPCDPHRRSDLEALKAAEAARQQAAASLTSSCATACLALTHSHAQQLGTAAADLSRLLLSLLDSCVLPADLVPAPEGDDALAGLQRLGLEELSRLAAAHDAAQPVAGGGGAAAAEAAQPAKTAPAAASKAGKQGGSGGEAAAAAASAARPLTCVSWQLGDHNVVSSVEKLGWMQADQVALVTSLQAVPPVPKPGMPPAGPAPGMK